LDSNSIILLFAYLYQVQDHLKVRVLFVSVNVLFQRAYVVWIVLLLCVIPSLTYPYFILFYEVTTVTLSVKGHTVKPTILIYSRRKSPIQFFDISRS